jgi:hypothetical protein
MAMLARTACQSGPRRCTIATACVRLLETQKTKRGFADVYIRPPVEQYNILDFGAYQQIADIGYRSAMEALGAWEGLQRKEGAPVEAVAGRAMAGPGPGADVTAPLHQALAKLEELLARMD